MDWVPASSAANAQLRKPSPSSATTSTDCSRVLQQVGQLEILLTLELTKAAVNAPSSSQMPDTDPMFTRDAFWGLIGTLGGAIDQERAQTLTDRLAEQTAADIVSFADHLARALYDLDSPERAAQLVVDPT